MAASQSWYSTSRTLSRRGDWLRLCVGVIHGVNRHGPGSDKSLGLLISRVAEVEGDLVARQDGGAYVGEAALVSIEIASDVIDARSRHRRGAGRRTSVVV
jgi:hypothetical protein